MCIPWTAKITNKEMLKPISPGILLEGEITKLRHHWRKMLCVGGSVVKDNKDAKKHVNWMKAKQTSAKMQTK